MIFVRRIRIGEGELFKQIRLTSLFESPSSFTTSYESALKRTPESWSEQADLSAEGTDRGTFFLFSENVAIGIAALYRDTARVDAGELIQVWVSPEYRGTGAAEILLEAVFNWARENGFHRILAGVNPGNVRALKFYQRLGFKAVGEPLENDTGRFMSKEVG